MSSTDTQLALAMPVGLPADGVDSATFFTTLSGLIEADVTSENAIEVWTDAAREYSGVYPMARSFAWYVPTGSPGLDGSSLVSTPTIYCRTWLDEYLSLRTASGGGGTVIPAVVEYSNLDESEVRSDVTTLVATEERYAALAADEKAAFVDGFMTGSAKLLVGAGARFGAGQVDSTHAAGYRKVSVRLLDTHEEVLAPSFYFSLWDAIGGQWIDDHPLIALVQGPVTPATAPVEGGTTVKVIGTALTSATTVTIGGAAATTGWATPDGTALYVTVPQNGAGLVDVVVGSTTHSAALAYTEDVVATARAAAESYAIHAEALADMANAYAAAGTLDDETRAELRRVLNRLGLGAGYVVERRHRESGASALDPAVADVFAERLAAIETLLDTALTAIG